MSRSRFLALAVAGCAASASLVSIGPACAQILPRIDVVDAGVPLEDGLRNAGGEPESGLDVASRTVASLHAALLGEGDWVRGHQRNAAVLGQLQLHVARTGENWDFTTSGWMVDSYRHAWTAQGAYRIPLGNTIGAFQAYAGTDVATSDLQSVTLPFRHAGWLGASYATFDVWRPIVGTVDRNWGRKFDDRLLLSAQTVRTLGRDDPPGTPRATSQYGVLLPLPVERFFVGGVLFAQTWTRDTRRGSWMDDTSVLVQYRPTHKFSFIVARVGAARDHTTSRRRWTETIAGTLPLWEAKPHS